MRTRLVILALGLAVSAAVPSAQSDLDALMSRVLARRDDNWKKLQQYVLEEKQTFHVTAAAIRLYGGQHEYQWFPRDGFFIRSPLRFDGVAVSEEDRRKEENRSLARAQAREKRKAQIDKEKGRTPDPVAATANTPSIESMQLGDVLRQSVEPEFVQFAYFLDFKFDEGHYALVGRETFLDRDVLKIEYYPTRLFNDDNDDHELTKEEQDKRDAANKARRAKETEKDRESRRKDDELDARVMRGMNKSARATFWVDPAINQILRYDVNNMAWDFLPGRSMMRIDELHAGMRMGQPFPDVWLPDTIDIQMGMTTALGRVVAHYDVKYTDYRLATTTARVR